MSPTPKLNYVKGIVICHGKSEYLLSRFITTNLHLNVKTFARDKGNNSIQITSLMTVLNAKPFNKARSFLDEYPVEVKGKGKKLQLCNFKIFIIMDTDDCTEDQKKAFMSGEMFSGHWLRDYIVPIYSISSLEDVMLDAKIMTKRIKDDEKGTTYSKIFPINKKPLSDDTLQEVKTFKSKIENSKKTNLLEFVNYCLSLLPSISNEGYP